MLNSKLRKISLHEPYGQIEWNINKLKNVYFINYTWFLILVINYTSFIITTTNYNNRSDNDND